MRIVLLLLALVACGPRGPHYNVYCVKSHSETKLVYWPNSGGAGFGITPYGVGLHVGGGLHYVNETVCDARDSTFVPADSGWVPKKK